MGKDKVMIDRATFFMGILFAVTIALVGYYTINKYFNKDKVAPPSHGQPQQPQQLKSFEKSPFIIDIVNESEAKLALSATGKPKVVLVHAPWCGHCKNMMGAYIQAASMEPLTLWMRNDGNIKTSIVARDDLRGFPTIYGVMADGKIIQHTGARDVNSLIAFSKSLSPQVIIEEIKETILPQFSVQIPPSVELLKEETVELLPKPEIVEMLDEIETI